MRTIGLFGLFFVCAALPLSAQDEDYGPQPQKAEQVRKWDAANRKRFGDNPDLLLLPGLVAKRKEGKVEVCAEATGASAQDAAEFLVLSTKSSHGYEALLWAHAKPSDIHRALEFVGAVPGGPRNPAKLRFWGKGGKVTVFVEDRDGGGQVALENLLSDTETGEALPENGYIFTGSMRVAAPGGTGETVYAADAYPPHSIISAFNDPGAVLDVGWEVSKQEAYHSYVANPEAPLKAHQLYTLALEVDSEGARDRIQNLLLRIKNPETFVLEKSSNGKPVTPKTTIRATLEACRTMVENGKLPYVTLRFSDDMQLGQIQPICRGMLMLDQPQALRIEPPLPGRLYYRSFLPNMSWREPAERTYQVWEVHVERKKDGLTGTLVYHEPVWKEGETEPEFNVLRVETPSGEDVKNHLKTDAAERKQAGKREVPPVLMVYAAADLSYGKLLEFLGPALDTHNTVHLFLER